MGTFISENIISENDITSNNLYCNTLTATTISGTTLFGDGLNITNVSITPTIGGNDDEILFNSSGTLNGNTNLEYDGSQLLFTGTSRFDGNFFISNSPSTEIRIQWVGAQTAGAAPGIIWTNMPALPTTWLHQTNGTFTGDATYIIDLTEYTEMRFSFSVQVGGFNTSNLIIQYSFNNSTWEVLPLTQLAVGTTTGLKDTGWVSIPVAARTFIYMRLVGSGGNTIADPRFSPPIIMFR
jgi:hypothetical protein